MTYPPACGAFGAFCSGGIRHPSRGCHNPPKSYTGGVWGFLTDFVPGGRVIGNKPTSNLSDSAEPTVQVRWDEEHVRFENGSW